MIPGRRFAAYGGLRRPNFRGAGGLSNILLRLPTGTFSRSSEAWSLDSDSLLDQYAANELRTEYRSDLGLYLLEGEKTNRVTHYRDATQWTVTGATTDSTSEDDPAGGNSAGQFSGTTGDTIEAPLATQPGDSTTVSTAVWVRGSGTVRVRHQVKDGTFVTGADITLTSSYQRIDVQGSTLTGATDVLPGVEIRAAGTTVDIYGVQLEDGGFPSSEIVTSGGAAVRAADALSFPGGEVPDRIRDGKWAFDFRPVFSSGVGFSSDVLGMENSAGNVAGILFRFNDRIEQRNDDGTINIVATSVTWSRHAIITITLDAAAGTMELEGLDVGDGVYSGSPWSWEITELHVSRYSGAPYPWGALSNLRKA